MKKTWHGLKIQKMESIIRKTKYRGGGGKLNKNMVVVYIIRLDNSELMKNNEEHTDDMEHK